MAQIRTYKNIQDEVLAWLDEATDQNTTRTLVKNAIVASHAKRVTEEAWEFMLWDSAQSISFVAGQQTYALHPEFFRPFYFKNLTAESYMTQFGAETLLESGRDWNNDQDSAIDFVLWGRTAVANQPTSASTLHVTSSNVTDNGAQSVTVRGDTASGITSETINCNSTGAVQFTKILNVTKSTGWVGTMTLRSNADAVTNLILFASEYGRSYQQMFLLASPTTAETGEYRFYRQPSPISADNDILDIPPPFDELPVYDALLHLAAYNQYDGNTLAYWGMVRDDLLLRMRQSLGAQARAIGAAANYTTYLAR